MKKVALLLAVVMFFAMVGTSLAASLAGTVSKADAKAGVLVVTGADGKDVTLSADAEALVGLKAGDKVNVEFETKDGKNTATKVEEQK